MPPINCSLLKHTVETDETTWLLATCYYRSGRINEAYYLLSSRGVNTTKSKYLLAKCAYELKQWVFALDENRFSANGRKLRKRKIDDDFTIFLWVLIITSDSAMFSVTRKLRASCVKTKRSVLLVISRTSAKSLASSLDMWCNCCRKSASRPSAFRWRTTVVGHRWSIIHSFGTHSLTCAIGVNVQTWKILSKSPTRICCVSSRSSSGAIRRRNFKFPLAIQMSSQCRFRSSRRTTIPLVRRSKWMRRRRRSCRTRWTHQYCQPLLRFTTSKTLHIANSLNIFNQIWVQWLPHSVCFHFTVHSRMSNKLRCSSRHRHRCSSPTISSWTTVIETTATRRSAVALAQLSLDERSLHRCSSRNRSY